MIEKMGPTDSSTVSCSSPRDGTEGPQVPVPPPFGAKQSWRARRVQWIELVRSEPQELGTANIGIAREYPLDEKYHSAYWQYVEHILLARAGYIEAELEPPWPYLLCDNDNRWIGLGFFAAEEDVNDFAYLCCCFLKQGKKVQLMPPGEVHLLSGIVDESYYVTMLGALDASGDASGVEASEDNELHFGSEWERKKSKTSHANCTSSNPPSEPPVKTKVPPAFGCGKPWKSRTFEWCTGSLADPSSEIRQMMIIPQGMTLHPSYHSVFWEARDNFERTRQIYAAAHIDPPWPYFLSNGSDRLVGCGLFDSDQELDELAWIGCMFWQRGLCVVFRTSEDVKALREEKEPQK